MRDLIPGNGRGDHAGSIGNGCRFQAGVRCVRILANPSFVGFTDTIPCVSTQHLVRDRWGLCLAVSGSHRTPKSNFPSDLVFPSDLETHLRLVGELPVDSSRPPTSKVCRGFICCSDTSSCRRSSGSLALMHAFRDTCLGYKDQGR